MGRFISFGPPYLQTSCSERFTWKLLFLLISTFPSEYQELNLKFSKPLREVLSVEAEVDDAALISIDSKGVDIRVRHGAQVRLCSVCFLKDSGFSVLGFAAIFGLQYTPIW